MEPAESQRVDHNALRTNQAAVIATLAAAYIADAPLLVILCGFLMLISSLFHKPAFLPVYRLLRAVKVIQPDLQPDRFEPHRFAQLVGAGVLLTAALAFALGAHTPAWILTMLVILLAGLNLFFGFCLGCTLYYWLARLGAPGFSEGSMERPG
ncbi:MAG: DUF4395 domain-containing protein [Anaerolineales bacterium]|nr:DUF4395 domain-containing protein [Anaerolineales bacterium]